MWPYNIWKGVLRHAKSLLYLIFTTHVLIHYLILVNCVSYLLGRVFTVFVSEHLINLLATGGKQRKIPPKILYISFPLQFCFFLVFYRDLGSNNIHSLFTDVFSSLKLLKTLYV